MKYILSILTIFAFASHIEAQVIAHQLDSIGQPLENKLQISDSVKLKYLSKHQKLMRLDSLNKKPVAFIDSATLKINNAENKVQLKTQALDSIKNKKLAVVDSTVLKINNKQQSILNKKNALEDSLNQVANKYQSLIQKKNYLPN